MTELLAVSTRPRRARRIALVAAIGILAVIAASSWIRLPPTRPRLPDPNGSDDLARAGSMIRGDWPNKGAVADADPAALRPFVQANRPALDLVRVGLGRESVSPLEDSEAGLGRQFERQVLLKYAARLLIAEGLVAEADGRAGDASRSYLDSLSVGQATTQGGMLTDAQLGWVLQKRAVDRLRKLRDHLPAVDLKATIRAIEAIDRRRVAPDAVVKRWERWYRGAFRPVQRIVLQCGGTEATERLNQQFQARKAHDAAGRALRFLMVELSIHASHGEKGAWPRSVADLVPAYLASVPIDPSTGRPLDYPANPSGELSDDLGSVARPDGEVVPRP